jgi:hypothetical protein
MHDSRFFIKKSFVSILTNSFRLHDAGYTIWFLRIAAVILFFNILSGCSYFKVATTAYPPNETISPLAGMDKTFVIHSDTTVFVINNIKIDSDSISGNYLSNYKLPYNKNTFPNVNSTNRYIKSKGDYSIRNEVHIYVQSHHSSLFPGYTRESVAIKDIHRFDIYSPEKGLTTLTWVLGIAAGVFISPFVLFGLIGLFGGSCPYIYVNNGSGMDFAGEIYSGAIYAPLERNDYLTLPHLVAEKGYYKLKISNELKEIQYTNLAELIVIDHSAKSEVLIDKYGKYQTAVDLRSPISATNFSGKDILNVVKEKDSLCYYGVTPQEELALTDGIIMTFDHPDEAGSGKLFLRARNSLWLDNVYKSTKDLFGWYNDSWTKKQNMTDSAKLMNRSLSQKLPLLVYVKKNGEWVSCDFYNMAGPAALKDDVLAIDLKGIDKGPVKIKLETGSYFWEIDYVAIDYSLNIPVAIKTVKPERAITNREELVTELMKYDDLKYYVQAENNDIADISFAVPGTVDSKRTVILHSKGYYQILNETDGFPAVKKLKALREPGQFLEYSRDLMKSELENHKTEKGLENSF